ncbi:Uncharacterised protein [Acinetobacter baumannii]|nr:Uncharacterised protein [Acinetobacter baumannii]
MHFIVNQVVQFQHVHIADSNLALELLTGTAIEQRDLTGGRDTAHFQQLLDFSLFRTVKHRRCDRHTFFQVLCQTQHFVVAEGVQVNFLANVVAQIVGLLDELTQLGHFLLLLQHLVDLLTDAFRSHTQVGFQDLTDVHT